MTGQGQNIGAYRVILRKLSHRVAIRASVRHDVPPVSDTAEIPAPASICRRHIAIQIPFYCKCKIRCAPVLTGGFRYGSDGTIAYIFTSWISIVIAIHIRAYRRGKALQFAQGKAIQRRHLRIDCIYHVPYPPYTHTSTAVPLRSFRRTPLYIYKIQQKRPNKEPEKGLCWVFTLWVFDMVGNLLVTVAAALLDILDRRKQPVCHLLSGLLLDVARDDAKRLVSRKIKRGDVINGTLRGHTAQLCADVSVSCIHGDYIRRGLAELWRKQGVGASLPRFRPDF
nr:MAG TPA: hypothetical protein [Caudoviricetes sp.]